MTRIKSRNLHENVELEVTSKVLESGGIELEEEVIFLNRVAKVVKGGRRFSFCALVAVGDKKCHVGVGYGKANQVPDAIRKAVDDAKKKLFRVPLIGRTIPHEVSGVYGSGKVMLKPAVEGTGIIAGPAVRAVVTLAGIKDILTKSLGTQTALNVVKATVSGLKSLQNPERIAEMRGKTLEEVLGPKRAEMYRQSKEELLSIVEPEEKKEEIEEKEEKETETEGSKPQAPPKSEPAPRRKVPVEKSEEAVELPKSAGAKVQDEGDSSKPADASRVEESAEKKQDETQGESGKESEKKSGEKPESGETT